MKHHKMEFDAVFKQFNRRPIAFQPIYKELTGSTVAAILLSQLMYWFFQVEKKFYKTDEEIMAETCLSEREIRTAKRVLKEMNFITIELKGVPARTHYEIHSDKMMDAIYKLVQTSSVKTSELESSKRRNSDRQNVGTITENTQETTTEKDIGAFDNALFPSEDSMDSGVQSIENNGVSPAPLDGFEEIWDLYAFKRSRPDAEKAYSKLSQKDKDSLRPGIESYLEFLKRPENSFRQQKLFAAFLRARMWEDDWGIPVKVTKAEMGEHTDAYNQQMEWAMKNYPNLSQLEWFNKEEYLAVKNREPDFCGEHWRYKATEPELIQMIGESLRELNDKSYIRKDYQRVYTFLKENIKKKLYA